MYCTDASPTPRPLPRWMATGCAWLSVLCLICTLMMPGEIRADADPDALARDITAFGTDLHHNLARDSGNLFHSPFSVTTALSMISAGARGETADQIRAVLRLSLQPEHLHPSAAALLQRLTDDAESPDITLRIANGLWPQEGWPMEIPFTTLFRDCYGVVPVPLDYVRKTEAARDTINAAVGEQTAGKIPELIPEGILNEMTRLVLTNAIHFKGDWSAPFRPRATTEAPFHLSPDQTTPVPLMQQTDRFRYAETDALQILELPYAGDGFAMWVVLPRALDGLAAVESALHPDQIRLWEEKMAKREVRVFLPRFRLTSRFRLDEVLKTMGMTAAFDPRTADFSGIDAGRGDLFIGAVIHQAFIAVDETGTEAAAATGITVELTSARPEPPALFRADRPFLFLILERESRTVLFMGRVANPSTEN